MINEGLEYGDMKGLISTVVSIDKYKPKLGSEEETVVVALSIMYEEPANEFSRFIENSDLDHLDVDVSTAPENGSYIVFIEFLRDFHLYEKISSLLTMIDHIVDKPEKWKYVAFRIKTPTEFNEKNFKRDVIDSVVEYRMKIIQENTDLTRLKQLVRY